MGDLGKIINQDSLERLCREIEVDVQRYIEKFFGLAVFFLLMAILFPTWLALFAKMEKSMFEMISSLIMEATLIGASMLNFSFYRQWKNFKQKNFKQKKQKEEICMSKEYRNGMREVKSDVTWTIWKSLPVIALGIIILVVLGWFLQSTGIINMNIEREVIQHSRQYTESKQAMLQNLYTQYSDLQTKVAEAHANGSTNVAESAQAKQRALLAQMKREATNIPVSQIPDEVKRLIQ